MTLGKSKARLYPYGKGSPIIPVGQAILTCDRNNSYATLNFQVPADEIMEGKPALLSGYEGENLGIISIKVDEIHAIDKDNTQTSDLPGFRLEKADDTQKRTPITNPACRNLSPAGSLTKDEVL